MQRWELTLPVSMLSSNTPELLPSTLHFLQRTLLVAMTGSHDCDHPSGYAQTLFGSTQYVGVLKLG